MLPMTSRRLYARICLITASAVTAALVIGIQPAAANLACGAVITRSTTLTHDLIDCPRNGIIIGASNVVLDLGGHTVDGTGTDVIANVRGINANGTNDTFIGNQMIGNSQEGFRPSINAVANRVERNIALRNGLVGFGLEASGSTIVPTTSRTKTAWEEWS